MAKQGLLIESSMQRPSAPSTEGNADAAQRWSQPRTIKQANHATHSSKTYYGLVSTDQEHPTMCYGKVRWL
jgi:hypothetical protein